MFKNDDTSRMLRTGSLINQKMGENIVGFKLISEKFSGYKREETPKINCSQYIRSNWKQRCEYKNGLLPTSRGLTKHFAEICVKILIAERKNRSRKNTKLLLEGKSKYETSNESGK